MNTLRAILLLVIFQVISCTAGGEAMKCKNGHEMKNLGNVSGVVLTSYPEQWDEVWICERCKEKKTVRVHAKMEVNLSDYTERDK